MAQTTPFAIDAMRRILAKEWKQAECVHDWTRDDVFNGYRCPLCDSWTADLMVIPVKRKDV